VGKYGGKAYYAARYGDKKLMQNTPFVPVQFFNTEDDPSEKQELKKEGDDFTKLWKNLQDHIRKSGAVPWQKPAK
jgi:hypothetical protein